MMNRPITDIAHDCGKCQRVGCDREVSWPGRASCEPCYWALQAELEMAELQEQLDAEAKERNCFGTDSLRRQRERWKR